MFHAAGQQHEFFFNRETTSMRLGCLSCDLCALKAWRQVTWSIGLDVWPHVCHSLGTDRFPFPPDKQPRRLWLFFLVGARCLSAGRTWDSRVDQQGFEPPPAVCQRWQDQRHTNWASGSPNRGVFGWLSWSTSLPLWFGIYIPARIVHSKGLQRLFLRNERVHHQDHFYLALVPPTRRRTVNGFQSNRRLWWGHPS